MLGRHQAQLAPTVRQLAKQRRVERARLEHGAFIAGTGFALVFRNRGTLGQQLSGFSYGFLIPIFFINVGIHFDLDAFRAPGAVTGMLALLGMGVDSVFDLFHIDIGSPDASGLGLFSSHTLSAFFLGFGWAGAPASSPPSSNSLGKACSCHGSKKPA